MVRASTYYLNLFPTRDGYKEMSPRELLTETKVDAASCAGIAFGKFAWVTKKLTDQQKRTTQARVFPGIALMPTGIMGGVRFLNMETFETVFRDQYEVRAMSQEKIDIMNARGEFDKDMIPAIISDEHD